MPRKFFIVLAFIGFTLPLLSHAEELVFTDPAIYEVRYGSVGGCCPNFVVASTTEQAPRPFYISRLQMSNQDISPNNHSGIGNVRAWIYDAQDIVIASSTNTCYVEGGCNASLNFDRQFVPTPFILRLILADGLQGNAQFNISSSTFYEDVTPLVSQLVQVKPNTTTTIPEGIQTAANPIAFGGTVRSPGGLQVKLQAEVAPFNQQFTNVPNLESQFVPSLSFVAVATSTLLDGQYHWQARAIDSRGNVSAWQEFGTGGNVDFVIKEMPTFPEVYADTITIFSADIGSNPCFCPGAILGEISYHLPSSFRITGLAVSNPDSSSNNHTGFGNLQAWIFDPNGNAIASSTNICYAEGSCGVFTFGGEFIPQDFKLKLIITDGLQGNARFAIRNLHFMGNAAMEPVIIVPGIMGSRLNRVSDGEEVWPNVTTMYNPLDPFDNYLDELKLSSTSQQIIGKEMVALSIIDKESIGVFTKIFYKNLVDAFESSGYSSGTTLFTFPYDWRLDIATSASEFNDLIRLARSNSPTGKVNIIAHSMGTLVVKKYLEGSNSEFVDKLILAGSPQLGSPLAFKALNYGDDMGLNAGIFGLNQEEAKDFSQNFPGVYQLLPSRSSVSTNGGYIKDLRNGTKILNFDETNQLMTSNASDSRNAFLLNSADTFHSGLDTEQFNASKVYNLVGCRNPDTIGEIRIMNEGKIDIGAGNGDGTVPLTSAMNLANNYSNYFVLYDKTGIDHTGLISDARTVSLIKDIITETPISLPDGISTSTVDCFEKRLNPPVNETTISFSTHSPVALHVYDSQGRHTGPLPNGDTELGIPSSNYEKFGENSFAFVPGGETYRVVSDGLAAGSFDLKAKTYSGSNLLSLVTFINVPLQSDQTNAELDFSGIQNNLNLNLDQNGDGIIDSVITPTGVLVSEAQANDTTSPVITVANIPSEVTLNSLLKLQFSATDDNSGITFVHGMFDGTPVSDGTIVIASTLGEHALHVEAEDKAGNLSTKELKFKVVYNFGGFLSPVKPDGSGVYKLGSTIPVKFQLKDASGAFITNATATLFVAQVSTGIEGTQVVALSTSKADAGNQFRYDATSSQYIFNLGTSGMGIGTWQLQARLGDGKMYVVDVSIKK